MHIIGNWKLNGSAVLIDDLAPILNKAANSASGIQVVACPPDIWVSSLQAALGDNSKVFSGAQNCSDKTHGAFTGETSATQLYEVGCRYVILGHSERRMLFGETSAQVAVKAAVACASGLRPVICIGENLTEREDGNAEAVCAEQLITSISGLRGSSLSNILIAYEPVWSIGTGKIASIDDISSMYRFIKQCLIDNLGIEQKEIEILYGGSVNSENAENIFQQTNVDGVLVGGASIRCDAFHSIVASAVSSRKVR